MADQQIAAKGCDDKVITLCYDDWSEVLAMRALAAQTTRQATERGTKRETLNLRIKAEVRELIDQAAELAGKNRTDFVLDAARQAAADTIRDRTMLIFPPEAYAAFMKLLDAPPRPNKRLRRALRKRAPWE